MDTLRSLTFSPRQGDIGLRNPLAQPGLVWAAIAPGDLDAVVRAMKLRRADAGGLFDLTAQHFGPATSWCVLGDNVIGVANWARVSLQEQYLAVHERAGAFIASAMLYLSISGDGASATLDQLSPRPVSDMPIGTARFILFTTASGTVDEEAVVLRTEPDTFLLSCGGGKPPRWLDVVSQRYTGVTVKRDTHASFNIKGPHRLNAILRMISERDKSAVSRLRPFEHCAVHSDRGEPVRILRTIIGYEVWAGPDILAHMWLKIIEQYPHVVPCGWDLLNIYRMECTDFAFALYPVDLHAGISISEANYSWMLRGDHEYIGKPSATGYPARQIALLGLEACIETSIPEIGEEVTNDSGIFQGYVTSSAYSPRRRRPLAFAHLRTNVKPGSHVVVAGVDWTVRSLPILSRADYGHPEPETSITKQPDGSTMEQIDSSQFTG